MSSKRKNRKKILIILVVVVVVVGLVAANLLIKRKPKGIDVDVACAKMDSLVQTVTASGKIQPEVDVNISAEVSGRIVYLGAEEGDNVTRGQLLVQVEDETYIASLQQMKFALASAEASLDEARSQLKRTRELHTSNLASDAELETREAVVKRFEADVDRVKANVTQAEDNLSKTKIHTPISGIVTRMNKEDGEMAIGASFTEDIIMVVSQLEKMEVNVEVNENDVVHVSPYDPVRIEVFAMPDTSFRGIVTEIAHSGIIRGQGSAEEVTNFEVKVSVLDKVPELRPGMSATVEIETDRRENALVLPQEAVAVRSVESEKQAEERARANAAKGGKGKKNKDKDDKKNKFDDEEMVEVVYVIENDTAWFKPVTLGIYSETHFEILEGIQENDLVITGPFRVLSRDLKSGNRVSYEPPSELEEEGEDDTDSIASSSEGEAMAAETPETVETSE